MAAGEGVGFLPRRGKSFISDCNPRRSTQKEQSEATPEEA